MAHWSDKYVGIKVIDGFDCASLAEKVQREVFGKELSLPTDKAKETEGTLEKFRQRTRQIMEGKAAFAERTNFPKDGDAVLIQTRGYRQHIGTLCFIANDVWVLHTDERAKQVVRARAREMAIRGYIIEGYYKWK
jgi:hypothetical protein